MSCIELSERQQTILRIIEEHGPITGQDIASELNLSRAALRPDLTILSMAGLIDARPRVGYYATGRSPSDIFAGLLAEILIGNEQSRPIVIRETASVYDAVVMMFMEDVGSIIVVSEGDYIEGIISRKDLLKAAIGPKNLSELPVKVVMTRMPNIVMATAQESVLRGAQRLIEHQIDTLPVVEPEYVDGRERFRVIGRFTKSNITQIFVRLAQD
ncbi:MAG: helix-turn-helix transcriptional regulator [Selenomonadales bacterium]|nr:helix-turn-helix transcriptional regulator [Selenomonadales bacterium]